LSYSPSNSCIVVETPHAGVRATSLISALYLKIPYEEVYPIQFLSSGMIQKGTSMLSQIQVRWSGHSSTLTTWEEVTDLHRWFSMSPAWGQAEFQVGGNVRVQKRKAKKDFWLSDNVRNEGQAWCNW
jgi:hypothetical protein